MSFKTESRQHSRSTGAGGAAAQQEATLSQLLYAVQPLVFDCGYAAADVFVDSYFISSELETSLRRWYGPWLVNLTLYDKAEVELRNTALPSSVSVLSSNSPYEAVLMFRPDLVFKPLFARALAAANRSQLLFTFREWANEDRYEAWPGIPRVADMLFWAPRWAFPMVGRDVMGFVNNHNAAWVAIEREKGASTVDVGFLLPHEQYDADPAKDGNPLYRLAEREEKPVRRTPLRDWSGAVDAFNNVTLDAVLGLDVHEDGQ